MERAQQISGRTVIALSALLCAAFPVIVLQLSHWMGRDKYAPSPGFPFPLLIIALLTTVVVCFIRNRPAAVATVALLAATGYLWIKAASFPYADQSATARPVWRQVEALHEPVCIQDLPRDWRYGLNYYTQSPLPDCGPGDPAGAFIHFGDRPGSRRPILTPRILNP